VGNRDQKRGATLRVLISDPGIAEGLDLRPGKELVFRPEHICAIDRPPDAKGTFTLKAGIEPNVEESVARLCVS